jgi:IS6 family transposase
VVLPATLFRKRQFAAEIIVTCMRSYLRFSLSLRDVEELMAERGLSVDHTTVWRWTQTYAPEVQHRLRGQVKPKGSTWTRLLYGSPAVGGTCSVPSIAAGRQWTSTYPKLATREAAKGFLRRALANPDNCAPHVFARDRLRSYPAAIRELQNEGELRRSCRHRTRRYSNNRIESDTAASNGACGACMARGP